MIRAALQARFEQIDEFRLTEGPEGARGQFFIFGDLTPRGQRPTTQVRADPTVAASSALAVASDLLRVELNEFTARLRIQSTDEQSVSHRRYDFIFLGWRVEDFELVTHIRNDGTLTAINGNVVRFLPPDLAQLRAAAGRITISAAEAEAQVRRAVDGVVDGIPGLERVIQPMSPYLFWTVTIGTRNPLGAWRYYVDAQSGAIRNRVDLMIR